MRRKVVFLSAIPWIRRRESSRTVPRPRSRVITLLETLIGGAALLLMVPVVVLFVEVLLAVTQRERTSSVAGDHPRVAVLVPAHDEALIISRTLRTILPQMAGGDRLVVVADNCTDDTAALATAEGAEALARRDLLDVGRVLRWISASAILLRCPRNRSHRRRGLHRRPWGHRSTRPAVPSVRPTGSGDVSHARGCERGHKNADC